MNDKESIKRQIEDLEEHIRSRALNTTFSDLMFCKWYEHNMEERLRLYGELERIEAEEFIKKKKEVEELEKHITGWLSKDQYMFRDPRFNDFYKGEVDRLNRLKEELEENGKI